MKVFKFVRVKKYRDVLAILLALVVIIIALWSYYTAVNVSINYNADWQNISQYDGVKMMNLEDIRPTANSIFFLEDHMYSFIPPRALCSAESTAVTNPTRTVFLLTSVREVKNTPVLRAMLANNANIHLGYFNSTSLFVGSPLEQWYKLQRWKKSKWPRYHFSDLLRWLMLWTYGGIYMDSDIILMRKLPNFSFVAMQDLKTLGAGAIALPPRHAVLTTCLNNIISSYNPESWISLGPLLLTGALKSICGDTILVEPRRKCSNITVLGNKSFYPIGWRNWLEYFNETTEREPLFEDEDIFGIHVWNAFSKYKVVDLTKVTPYSVAATKFCPSVVKTMGDKM